jgi:magnesium-transporting ATPase (P-type)
LIDIPKMSEVSLEEIVLAANSPANSSALTPSKLVPIPRGSVELKRDQTLEDFKASDAAKANLRPSGSPRAAATRKSIDHVSALTAAGVGLSHRVSVEIQSRSSIEIRQSIDDRQKKLQARVSGAAVKKEGSSSAQGELNQINASKKVADIIVHSYSFAEISSILHTDLSQGLTGSDAKTRLLRDGPNRLTPPKQTPWWIKLIKQLVGGFQLMLIGAAILCWVVANLSNPVDQQTNFLGYVLVIVVVVTGVFAFFQESKSDKVMEGFKALTPSHCHVIRNGIVIECPAEELVVGDVVAVQFGEKVPADLRIIQCSNLKVDNSSLTGEAEPLSRTVEMTHENPMETKNIAFYGTFFTEGSGKGVVFQTGDRTFLGTIASAAIGAAQPDSTLQRELHYFVKSMACLAVGQGVIFFLIAVFAIKYPILQSLIFAIGLITANVPEGLLPQLTIILTLAARRMKSINVLVKNLEIMETLGCTTCIASDKTGTLTQNKMTVSHVYYGGAIHNSGGNAVSGAHYPVFEKANRDFALLQASPPPRPLLPSAVFIKLATNHRFCSDVQPFATVQCLYLTTVNSQT